MEKMNSAELKEYDKIKNRYDQDRNLLIQAGHDKNYIYRELSLLYPDHPGFLQNDIFFSDRETRKKSRTVPQCIETKNSICMPGLLTRYSINNYDLDTRFEEVFSLILERLTSTTPDGSPPSTREDPYEIVPDPIIIEPEGLITMGVFLITVWRNFI